VTIIAIAQNRSFARLNTKAALLKQTGKTAEADKLIAESIGLESGCGRESQFGEVFAAIGGDVIIGECFLWEWV